MGVEYVYKAFEPAAVVFIKTRLDRAVRVQHADQTAVTDDGHDALPPVFVPTSKLVKTVQR